MAGAGYKLFVTGDVLTAAQVNTYLQEQTVMSFADAAARTSALSAVLAEGMMSYLRDTNAVQVYNGSAWVAVGGSIPLTTKGDLLGYDTAVARIPIGTNNQVLTADSTQALGLKWATPAGGGKVLQVIQATTSTAVTVATSSETDTGLSATITPSSATSRILVLVYQNINAYRALAQAGATVHLYRGATKIVNGGGGADNSIRMNISPTMTITDVSIRTNNNISYVDSPSTTSATTYKTTALNYGTWITQYDSALSTMVLMEIGA
jgi:hypothetical protein